MNGEDNYRSSKSYQSKQETAPASPPLQPTWQLPSAGTRASDKDLRQRASHNRLRQHLDLYTNLAQRSQASARAA